MKFEILNDEEFDIFSKESVMGSYVQTSSMKKIKEDQGYKTYLVGVKKNNRIICGTMMYSMNTKFNKKIFYAPRGFILDYNDIELLNFFTVEIKKFVNNLNGIKLIIDPKVVYQFLDNEGNSISDKNDKVINNLKNIGYKHFGFNKNYETIQVRYCSMVNLKDNYDEMLKSFSKSTRKHINDIEVSGIKVRKGNFDDLATMTSLLDCSAIEKHFEHRDLKYYKLMYKHIKNIMNIYIAYIDFDDEKILINNLLEESLNEKDKIENEMKKVNVGSKLISKLDIINKKIDNYNKRLKLNDENRNKYGKELNIASLLSIISNDEYISLFSGMRKEFVSYNPKYALYNAHIKDAIKYNLKTVNFYGIPGDFDKRNPLYGIFEIKKGFNGYVKELIGEFDLPINNWYYIHNILSKITHK